MNDVAYNYFDGEKLANKLFFKTPKVRLIKLYILHLDSIHRMDVSFSIEMDVLWLF